MRNRNEGDVLPLVDYAVANDFDISFIEEMPLGDIMHDGSGHDRAYSQYSSAEVLEQISRHYTLLSSAETTGGPSRYHSIPGVSTRIGVISPNSHNFCPSCNRVRVTAEGRLLLCLGHENSLDLRDIIRRYPGDIERLKDSIRAALINKPERHEFDVNNEAQIVRFMNMTGG